MGFKHYHSDGPERFSSALDSMNCGIRTELKGGSCHVHAVCLIPSVKDAGSRFVFGLRADASTKLSTPTRHQNADRELKGRIEKVLAGKAVE
jgi:hypothetical protein